jgi:hypothetical protein
VLVLIVGLGPAGAFAEVTWDGGGNDNFWKTLENWSNDKLPTLDDDVNISPTSGGPIEVILDTDGAVPLPGEFFPIALKDARTLKIGGTGSQPVKLVFDGSEAAATGLKFSSDPPVLQFEIGPNGTVETQWAALFKHELVGFTISVQNKGTIRVFAPTFGYVKIEGSLNQTSQGSTEIHLPVTRVLVNGDDPNALFAALGPMSLSGELLIYSPDPNFVPTSDNWPSAVPFRIGYGSLTKSNLTIMFNNQSISSNGQRITYTDPNTNRLIIAELLFGTSEATFAAAVLGDMDGNGVVNAFDVDDFEAALANPAAFAAATMIDPHLVGDINVDGVMDNEDISAFENLLIAQGLLIDPDVFELMMELFAEE